MNNKERISKFKEKDYREMFGVKKTTFCRMLEILEEQFRKDHAAGGSPPKVSVLDRLVMMLCYYREYRTMQHIAFDYGVAKSTVFENIRWAENVLIKSGVFRLPSKKEVESDASLEVVLLDATEVEIERPQKNKGDSTPARKKSIP